MSSLCGVQTEIFWKKYFVIENNEKWWLYYEPWSFINHFSLFCILFKVGHWNETWWGVSILLSCVCVAAGLLDQQHTVCVIPWWENGVSRSCEPKRRLTPPPVSPISPHPAHPSKPTVFPLTCSISSYTHFPLPLSLSLFSVRFISFSPWTQHPLQSLSCVLIAAPLSTEPDICFSL